MCRYLRLIQADTMSREENKAGKNLRHICVTMERGNGASILCDASAGFSLRVLQFKL